MMNTRPLPGRQRGRGFSLIEVLVAIVVLAIGVLGVAALQSKSMSQGQGSLQATQAMALAYDMADRIRANPCGAYTGNYEIQRTSPPTGTVSPQCNAAGNCTTAAQMAAWDKYDWYNNQVRIKLPSVSGVEVKCSDGFACSSSDYGACGSIPNPPQTISITIWWAEKGANNDSATAPNSWGGCGTGTLGTTDYTCVTLSVQP